MGVIELSPCSGLGSKLLGLLMGLRRSLPLLPPPWEPQIMALREYSEKVISRVRAVTVWWEDADVHWVNKGPPSLNGPRMVNGQLPGSFIGEQARHLFSRD